MRNNIHCIIINMARLSREIRNGETIKPQRLYKANIGRACEVKLFGEANHDQI